MNVKRNENQNLSIYTWTLNCLEEGLPLVASLKSALGCANEVIVVDAGSRDGTREYLKELSNQFPKLKLFFHQWNYKDINMDWKMYALARSYCTSKWCMVLAVDEVIHEKDYIKISNIIQEVPQEAEVIHLPMLNFWGDPYTIDVKMFWGHKLTPNLPHITHGFNTKSIVEFDKNGEPVGDWSKSDGCEFIYKNSWLLAKNHIVLIPQSTLKKWQAFLNQNYSKEAFKEDLKWLIKNNVTIYHYSWLNPFQKVKRLVKQKRKGFNWNPYNMKDIPVREEDVHEFVTKLQKEKEPFLITIEDIDHPEVIRNSLFSKNSKKK